jgi:hypothetical protein
LALLLQALAGVKADLERARDEAAAAHRQLMEDHARQLAALEVRNCSCLLLGHGVRACGEALP